MPQPPSRPNHRKAHWRDASWYTAPSLADRVYAACPGSVRIHSSDQHGPADHGSAALLGYQNINFFGHRMKTHQEA